jgi:5-methylcytosine-specific restriction endonuclease McrA
MARPQIARALREKVATDAGYRCGYCLTPQAYTAMPMHVEHIVPIAAGGPSTEDNLWLACPLCNGHKGRQTHAIDPESGDTVPLFNPRSQSWQEHFAWSEDGTLIVGSTPVGRATVVALKLNNQYLVQARRRWVAAGWHPPTEP